MPPWWVSILGVKVEAVQGKQVPLERSEEHTSELQSHRFISYAVFCFLDFLELRQVLSTYDGDLRDTLWWP